MMHAMRRATSADGAVQGIQAGRYLGMTNTAVWCWRVGRVLVDTGPPNQWSIVKREIARLGGVDLVLASHHHEDHAGNGAQLQSELGCKVLAAPSSLAYLREGYPQEWYRLAVWGRPTPFEADPMPEEVRVDCGEGLGPLTMRRVWAPGHCPDHHVIFCPERKWLFAGDLFVSARPRLFRFEEDAHDQIASLERVLELDFETVFCSHKGIVTDGRAALARRLAWLKSLRRAVTRAVVDADHTSPGAAPDAAAALARRVLGPEPWFARLTLMDFSQRNLVASLMRQPRYAHAAAERRAIGRPASRAASAASVPADAKASLGELRLGYGDPLVRLAGPDRDRAEWTFGSPDDVLPGVSRLLGDDMARPEQLLAAATADDDDGRGGGGTGPASLDAATYSPLDASRSGAALIGGVTLRSAAALLSTERRRRAAAAAALPAPRAADATPTLPSASEPHGLEPAVPAQPPAAAGRPRRDPAVPSPSRAGEAVTEARPTVPGWQGAALIAAQRAAGGFPDTAATPVRFDSLAELALRRARSPARLRWAQAALPRPAVPPAGDILEALREQARAEAEAEAEATPGREGEGALFGAPTERVRGRAVLRALEDAGFGVPDQLKGAVREAGAEGEAGADRDAETAESLRRAKPSGDVAALPRPLWLEAGGEDDLPGLAELEARALQDQRPDLPSVGSDDVAAQRLVDSRAMDARLAASLASVGIVAEEEAEEERQGREAEEAGVSGRRPEGSREPGSDVRKAWAAMEAERQRRLTRHEVPAEGAGAGRPARDDEDAEEARAGALGSAMAAVFGRPELTVPVGWEPAESRWERARAASASTSAASGATAPGRRDDDGLAELAAAAVDAEEDATFRRERRSALARRRRHRAFVEEAEQKRLAEAERWLGLPGRKPVPGIDAGAGDAAVGPGEEGGSAANEDGRR